MQEQDLFSTEIKNDNTITSNNPDDQSYILLDDKSSDDEILSFINLMVHPPEPTVVAVDTETTFKEKYKNNPKAGLSPIFGRVRLVQFYFDNPITKKSYIIDAFKIRNVDDLIRLVLSNEKTIKILQNAKFDTKMIKASFDAVIKGIIFDPMLAGQLIDFNQKSNLDILSQIYLNIPVDKKLQRSDFSGELSHLQLEYASKDVRILPPLREALIQKMKHEKLIRIALLEFNAIQSLADLELNGFPVNYYQYQQLIKSLEEDVKELHSKKDPEYIKYYNINDKFGRSFFEKNIYQETNACHMDYRQISSPTGTIGTFGKIRLEDMPNNECFRSCFTPQDKDDVFLIGSFYIVGFKGLISEIVQDLLISNKNNITSVHSPSGRKIMWNRKPELKEVEGFYKESIINDTLKRVLYLIREEITSKTNVKLVAVIGDKIYLECSSKKIEDIKDRFINIIYKSWAEYHFQNPIIPEIKIARSWNEVK